MSKTPVSLLQEIAVRKRFSLPGYEFECSGTPPTETFRCVVTMGPGQQAEGRASNKKDAKHEAAANLLRSLGVELAPKPQARTLNDFVVTPQVSPSPPTLNLNYIGMLNEWAAQTRHSAPSYVEDTTELNGFTIVCKFLDRSTRGYGANKKSAKQEAAKNMYELAKTIDIAAGLPQKMNETFSNPSHIAEVMKKYNELVDNFKHIKFSGNNNNNIIGDSDTVAEADAITSWTELTNVIVKRGWTSSCTTFQSQPLIMAFNINEYKFLASGESSHVIKEKLLTEVVSLLREGFDFSRPVFEP